MAANPAVRSPTDFNSAAITTRFTIQMPRPQDLGLRWFYFVKWKMLFRFRRRNLFSVDEAMAMRWIIAMTHNPWSASRLFAATFLARRQRGSRYACLAGFVALASSASLRADVRLPALFTDHMVLQQSAPVPVWGWADDGERVTVEMGNQKVNMRL